VILGERRPLLRQTVPVPEISRSGVGAFEEFEETLVGIAHMPLDVIGQDEFAEVLMPPGACQSDCGVGEARRLRVGVGWGSL